MTEKRLHIVSFDVPFPADYGGAIDVFYRLKALHELGIKITLHCFEYGRGQAPELEEFAEKVIYYKRRKSIWDVFSRLPFIVKTRISKELLNNLLADENPILFEGLHTTFLLNDPRFKTRNKMVRMHNIEHDYYTALADQSRGFHRWFYQSEARKLARYETQLSHANSILAIKETDATYFKKYVKESSLLPACSSIQSAPFAATKPYCLFQGNLSVEENEQGLNWLIETVFLPNNLIKTLKVAGKDPSPRVIERCKELGIDLKPNPSDAVMDALNSEARIHVFHTNQDTGIKLKLLNALRTPGAIIANDPMFLGTPFEAFCVAANSPEEYTNSIETYLETPLAKEHFESRIAFIENQFDPVKNCRVILELI